MKAYNNWNYRPYMPYTYASEAKLPYICRLAPSEFAFELEWFDHGCDGAHTLYYAKRASGDFKKIELNSNKVTVNNLESYTDYEVYIEAGNGAKSNTRLVRTGFVPGTVINYLHPEDKQYAFSGRYLCSPSIAKMPSGTLIASMDLFAGNHAQNVTVVFRSTDDGKSWEYVTDLMPCFWGSLFVHGGKLWMLATSNEYGDLLIGCSDDEGVTWSEPTVILRGASVATTCQTGGPHKAPVPVIESGGRIWMALEYGGWHCQKGFANMVISAPTDCDLMNADFWSISEPVFTVPEEGGKAGSIEGNVFERADGSLVNMLRYAPGKSTVFKIDRSNPEAPLEFEGICPFPMAHTKFEIRKFSDGCFYALGNGLPARTSVAIYKSYDGIKWEMFKELLNYDNLSADKVGFQYPSFIFDGNDMLITIRTAFNLAHNFHDANYTLFFRVSL